MEEEIKAFFGENSAKENFRLKAAEIVVGMIAICFTKTRISRVRVGSTKDARNVHLVRDIDKHESFVVSVQDLYYPPPEFLRTPAKVIAARYIMKTFLYCIQRKCDIFSCRPLNVC